ncbi:hypothetical protein U1Q18_007344 [Sarracenia purpurea var. burkii]
MMVLISHRVKSKQNEQAQCLCKSVRQLHWNPGMAVNRLRVLATSPMFGMTIDVWLMRIVESMQSLVGEDRAAWLATVAYGCSYEIHQNSKFFLQGGNKCRFCGPKDNLSSGYVF